MRHCFRSGTRLDRIQADQNCPKKGKKGKIKKFQNRIFRIEYLFILSLQHSNITGFTSVKFQIRGHSYEGWRAHNHVPIYSVQSALQRVM